MAAASRASPVMFLLVASAVLGLLLLAPVASAGAAATQLTPCAAAIVGNAGAPTAACCARLKAHPASCFCQYMKNPSMQRYVNSPNANKVFAAYKVPPPKCSSACCEYNCE